jgi:uncharacterized protein
VTGSSKNDLPGMGDRLAARLRPEGSPLMYQSWGSLLFMHWRVDPEILIPLLPERVSIDTFHGSAWVAITPFTLWNVRPIFVPPLPWVSDFHEINVRTYVHVDKVPGVWFFSLDASATLPVIGARALFHLPYYDSKIKFVQTGNTIDCTMKREAAERSARFKATWLIGDSMPESVPGSMEFFLTERYCLYTQHKEVVYRCRIHHRPWPLQRALVDEYETDLFEANSIGSPLEEPILHSGGPVDVEVWPLEKA